MQFDKQSISDPSVNNIKMKSTWVLIKIDILLQHTFVSATAETLHQDSELESKTCAASASCIQLEEVSHTIFSIFSGKTMMQQFQNLL